MRPVNRLLLRLRSEQGFTLLPVMGLVMALMLLSAAALAQSANDGKPAARDRDEKTALAAAQAGVQDYLARLRQNNTYWTQCTKPAALPASDAQRNPSLNDGGVAYESRGWLPVGGSSTARFSVELLPAPGSGYDKCDPTEATDSMIDKDSGAFRIRVTGEAWSDSRKKQGRVRRSLIATFRPRGFLDYIYFTDLETMDPAWYRHQSYGRETREDQRSGTAPNGAPWPKRNIVQWATDDCSTYYFDGRASKQFRGTATSSGSGNGVLWFDSKWRTLTKSCGEIQFVGGDKILGPFHTNDSINVCGSPQFGEISSDRIEMRGGSDPDGWRAACAGSDPNEVGTWVPQADFMQIPESNTQLYNDAEAPYRFRGQTRLVFTDNGKVSVTGKKDDGTPITNLSLDMPRNGVIYVSNDTASPLCGAGFTAGKPNLAEYDAYQPANVDASCGNAIVSGTYSQSVTIGSERDIVIEGDITRKDDESMAGLIANGFVRVKHPIKWDESKDPPTCSEDGAQLGDVSIDAAILSLNHSFTVDGYYCGTKRGTLHVYGAIAQKYRGPVGTGGNSVLGTGYLKDYKYDRRLRYRSPPRFINPAGAQWNIINTVEEIPSTIRKPLATTP